MNNRKNDYPELIEPMEFFGKANTYPAGNENSEVESPSLQCEPKEGYITFTEITDGFKNCFNLGFDENKPSLADAVDGEDAGYAQNLPQPDALLPILPPERATPAYYPLPTTPYGSWGRSSNWQPRADEPSYFHQKLVLNLQKAELQARHEEQKAEIQARHEERKFDYRMKELDHKAECEIRVCEARESTSLSPFVDADGFVRLQKKAPGREPSFGERLFGWPHIRATMIISARQKRCVAQRFTWLTSEGMKQVLVKDMTPAGFVRAIEGAGNLFQVGRDRRRNIEDMVYSFLLSRANSETLPDCFGWNLVGGRWVFAWQNTLTVNALLKEEC